MEHILLVEDEPTNLRILSAYLRKAGYIIDEAVDGQSAWEKLSSSSDYAVVVTDRNMPRMDGLQLFTKIRMSENLHSIPVIMQTAADSPGEVVEGIKAGVYYYLTKPYEETTLLMLVQAAIRERKQHEWVNARLVRQQEALDTFMRGEFHIRTPEEAQNIAYLLGSLFPRPEAAVSGLYELLINAIEHGNLGIGYEEKARLLAERQWEGEISNRLQKMEYARKKVVVSFVRDGQKIEVSISDEGNGFDWRPYLEIEPARAMQSNGRGIAKANLIGFDRLAYTGNGNRVHVLSSLAA